MKKYLICFLMAFLMLGATPGFAQTQPPANAATATETMEPLNRIVAVVNDEIISQSELDSQIEQRKQELAARNIPLPSALKLREEALQELIDYHMEMQMAARNNIKATPEEVDAAVAQVAKSNHLTVDQLKQKFSETHVNFDQFRAKLADQLAVGKLQQQMVAGQMKVTDADIAEFKKKMEKSEQGKEYHLIDFYLPLPERPSSADLNDALVKARNIQKQLEQGAALDTITPTYQDLGWRDKNNLPQLFAEQLKTLTLQNASQPLRAPNGYHVLKLLETRTAAQTLTDAQIRDIVLREKFSHALKAALEKARKEAYIQIIPQ